MKNKRLAVFLVIFVFLALIVVLSSAVFSLKTVTVNFLSTTNELTSMDQSIIDSGKFKYGENVFFSTKKTYIQNLEKANPYLRVINIETIFPNKYVINAVERNETYVIKLSNNKYAKTDEYLKVLEISNVYQNNTSNGIEIKNSDLVEQNVEVGDFFSTKDTFLTEMFKCFREWDTSYVNLKAKISSVEMNYDSNGKLLINMRSGVQILVQNMTNQLSDKLNLAFSFYDCEKGPSGEPADYTKSGIIEVIENESQIYVSYRSGN